MKRKCMWLVISHVLEMATAMFFYDKPLVINPADVDKETYLGYSLSYQKNLNNLVVGSPNDVTGKVFTCPLNLDSASNYLENNCTRYDKLKDYVNNLPNTKRYNKDYKFMLGTSVAALPNSSFVTCAPMWSGEISKMFYVWGACFEVKNNGDVKALEGLYGPEKNRKSLIGNFGMRMVADDINDLILISKPASPPAVGDIVHIKQTNPLNSMTSLIENESVSVVDASKNVIKKKLASYRNLGIALANGNFFKKGNNEKIIYAIGLTDKNADGEVIFLKLMSNNKLFIKNSKYNYLLQIKDDTKFSMLGAALCSASLDNDEYTDLIVGAPALPGNQMEAEYGAVHIYLGTYDADDFVQRKLTIMGKKEGSRFGSTISAHDLDSDGLPEIFISALYENEGVLYILSGYEMKEKLDQSQPRPIINVVDFKSRQEIGKEDFKLLGFSILPVSDLDNNGCDELAVGAPGSDKIIIFRCIPTTKINVTAELMEYKAIPVTKNDFKVLVCINLNYQSKTEKIAAKVEMINTIHDTGKVTINETDKTFNFDISNKDSDYCRNVSVHIADNRPGSYKFQARAKLINNEFGKPTFDRSWVRDSSYSVLSKLLIIQRACSGKECEYNLTMDLKWSGGELNEKAVPAGKYAVGSKDETMTFQISNWGRPAYDACVLIKVEHAPVSKLDCMDTPEGYLCILPAGFMPKEKRDIDIHLKTSKLTDEYRSFQVYTVLYNECDKKYTNQTRNIIIDYEFNGDDLLVTGTSNTRSITEKSMKSDVETIDVVHTYTIENKGSVLWKNVTMDVLIAQEMTDFTKDLKVHTGKCSQRQANSMKCTLDLEPLFTTKVVVTMTLRKKQIEKSLMENSLKVKTELTLIPKYVTVNRHARVEAVLVYQKDSSLGQNKTLIILIAIIVAIIIIAVVILVLYKMGFFKRKQKEELQEEIRRRSVRRSNATSQRQDSLVEIMEEDMDDDAFHCDDPPANAASTSSDRHSARDSKQSITKKTTQPENEKDQ